MIFKGLIKFWEDSISLVGISSFLTGTFKDELLYNCLNSSFIF